jgi:hypothetical protein
VPPSRFNKYKDLEREAKELGDEVAELRRLKKEMELQSQSQATSPPAADMDVTKSPEFSMSGQVPIDAPTPRDDGAAADVPRPASPTGEAGKRLHELQERFAKLAQQQQALAHFEDDIMRDKRRSSIKAGGDVNQATQPVSRPETPALPDLPSPIGIMLQGVKEDDDTRFGANSQFSRDSQRDETFLRFDEIIPAPRLLELHDVVLDLRRRIDTESVPDYMDLFEQQVPAQEVVIAKIPVEEIEKKEKIIEEVRVRQAEEEAGKYKKREMDLAWREHLSRRRLLELEREARDRINEKKRRVIEENMAHERALQRLFIAAKERLEKLIYSQKAHFTEKYGVLETGELATGRRFLINWDHEPQPIEMRIHQMRAVKNKLPAGRYCLLLTPYERLGGNPIYWSKLVSRRAADTRVLPCEPLSCTLISLSRTRASRAWVGNDHRPLGR